MTVRTTVMFADLTGSTSVFEALGNEAATQTITALTQRIGKICQKHRGRVVKTLGDGVLVVFPDGGSAVDAVVHLQRDHAKRKGIRAGTEHLELQVGLDCGDIVEVDGDCYGDAVNVASRMADLSGARQIWATDSVTGQLEIPPPGVRFHSLGTITIRGKAQPRRVFRVEWQEDTATDMMTLPGWDIPKPAAAANMGARIELQYLDITREFGVTDLPIHLGRATEAEFVVSDRRVSRLHARLEWRNGAFVLVDMSSFGTCVRFQGTQTEIALRRDETVLHDSGEIALAGSFEDFTTPTLNFRLLLPAAWR